MCWSKEKFTVHAQTLHDLVAVNLAQCPATYGEVLAGDVDDPAVSGLTTTGGLRSGAPATGWVSHIAHTGDLMACDLVLTRGGCHVRDFRVAGTQEALIKGEMASDHRPIHAVLVLGEGESAATE
jgi:endonuclease/exonuclease/phosphatase family metal-dependent hydrolase